MRKVVDPHLLAYNDTWDKVDAMLADCLSPDFRDRHAGFVRRRLGLQLVLRRPRGLRRQSPPPRHGLPQRVRPLSRDTPGDGLRRRTACTSTTTRTRSAGRRIAAPRTGGQRPTASHQTLSRRVIDRRLVPGGPPARVPRDPARQPLVPRAVRPVRLLQPGDAAAEEDAGAGGLEGGRLGDWRRAPADWQPYHPAHDDYQVPRRLPALDRPLPQHRHAVPPAHRGRRATGVPRKRARASRWCWRSPNHDFRDMRPDIDGGAQTARAAWRRTSPASVPVQRGGGGDARRAAAPVATALRARRFADAPSTTATRVGVASGRRPTFGPQPWLALRTVGGHLSLRQLRHRRAVPRWRYVFDEETFPLQALDAIGVAANNASGVATVVNLDPAPVNPCGAC